MKLKSLLTSSICLFIFSLLITVNLNAQVTTATLNGTVKDSKGSALASATVTVEYPDAGLKYKLITRADGRFVLPNLRVGGPYSVSIEHVSFQKTTANDLYLELGLNNTIDVVLEEIAKELGGVTVSSRSKIFDDKRTGASTIHGSVINLYLFIKKLSERHSPTRFWVILFFFDG